LAWTTAVYNYFFAAFPRELSSMQLIFIALDGLPPKCALAEFSKQFVFRCSCKDLNNKLLKMLRAATLLSAFKIESMAEQLFIEDQLDHMTTGAR
jgi:hypothetical protein